MDLITNGTGNGTFPLQVRISSIESRLGIFQSRLTGTGTATVTLYNGFNNAALSENGTHTLIGAGTAGQNTELLVPYRCYAVISGSSGTFSVTASVDGVES